MESLDIPHGDGEFGFGYRFVLPKGTKDLRSKNPFKSVKKEYFIMSLMSLIGNVGGTFGMFVGLSIIGVTDLVLEFLDKCFKPVTIYLRRTRPNLMKNQHELY